MFAFSIQIIQLIAYNILTTHKSIHLPSSHYYSKPEILGMTIALYAVAINAV